MLPSIKNVKFQATIASYNHNKELYLTNESEKNLIPLLATLERQFCALIRRIEKDEREWFHQNQPAIQREAIFLAIEKKRFGMSPSEVLNRYQEMDLGRRSITFGMGCVPTLFSKPNTALDILPPDRLDGDLQQKEEYYSEHLKVISAKKEQLVTRLRVNLQELKSKLDETRAKFKQGGAAAVILNPTNTEKRVLSILFEDTLVQPKPLFAAAPGGETERHDAQSTGEAVELLTRSK